MMLRRNRVVARPRAGAPRNFEIILSVEDRRKFVNFIMLLNTAERSSNVINNARKKVKQSKIRDGPQSSGLFLLVDLLKIFFPCKLEHELPFFKEVYEKTRRSLIRVGPLSKRVFLFVYRCFIFMMHLLIPYYNSNYDRHRSITFATTCIPDY